MLLGASSSRNTQAGNSTQELWPISDLSAISYTLLMMLFCFYFILFFYFYLKEKVKIKLLLHCFHQKKLTA